MMRIILFTILLILVQACSSYSLRQEFFRDEIKYQLDAGNTLYKQGKLEDAMIAYRKAIRLVPNNAEAHASLGNVYLAKGDMQNAEKQYRRAIALKPELNQTLEPSLAYVLSSPVEGNHATVTGLLKALKDLEKGNMRTLEAYASSIKDMPAWSASRHRVLDKETRNISQRMLKLYDSGLLSACPGCLNLAASWCAEEGSPEHFPLIRDAIKGAGNSSFAAWLALKLGVALERHGDHSGAMNVYLMFPEDEEIAKRLSK